MTEEGLGSKRYRGIKEDGTAYKIMIVDDSMFVIKQLSHILKADKYEIIAVAYDGLEALNKYKEFYPNIDLVTMDVTMPKMDGLSSLKKIIEFDKDARVIVISAIGKKDFVKEALISGARNYITKPINRIEVIKRIRNALY